MNNFKDQNTVILCDCSNNDCTDCPTLERQEGKIVFRDDFGGKVVLTDGEFNLLVQLIEQKRFADWISQPSASN